VVAMRSLNGLLTASVIEVKTRTTTATVGESSRLARQFGAVSGLRVESDTSHAAFQSEVPVLGDRTQLLHHAAVFDVESVFYVEASSTGIIRVVRVTFTAAVRSMYRSLMTDLYMHVTGCSEPEQFTVTEVDTEFSNERCPDRHTLLQSHALWLAAIQLVDENRTPATDCRSLRPYIVSHWNKAKVPVDSISQYLGSAHPAAVKDRPSMFAIVERLLTYTFLQIHLVTNLFSIDTSLLQPDNDSIKTVRQLRQLAIGHDNSFKSFLGGPMLEHLSQMAGATLQQPTSILGHSQQSFTLPAHSINHVTVIQLFDTPEGQVFRKSGRHTPLTVSNDARHRCLICNHLIATKCVKCTYFFCSIRKVEDGVEQPSCWEKHHPEPA